MKITMMILKNDGDDTHGPNIDDSFEGGSGDF